MLPDGLEILTSYANITRCLSIRGDGNELLAPVTLPSIVAIPAELDNEGYSSQRNGQSSIADYDESQNVHCACQAKRRMSQPD